MAEFKPSCEPVAWIDAADFEVLESDRWCVVHTDCCDPGADHNASEPLYTAAQLAAEVAKAVEAERERCAVVAANTVCDTHLPTGVRIYGTRAATAIRTGDGGEHA